jgi:hypothetical protein
VRRRVPGRDVADASGSPAGEEADDEEGTIETMATW